MDWVKRAQDTWLEILVEWGLYLKDVGAYNARLHEEASEFKLERPSTNWLAVFLVAILPRRKFTFVRTEVTAARHVLQHHGDVWVGVTNTSQKTCRYDLWLVNGGANTNVIHRTFSLFPGESQLLLDTNAVPSICLQYVRGDCRIDATSPPFAVVDCILSDFHGNDRRTLAMSWWTADGITFSNGVAGEEVTARHVQLPGLEEPWQVKAARKRRWTEALKEELMKVACHPRRLAQIGND